MRKRGEYKVHPRGNGTFQYSDYNGYLHQNQKRKKQEIFKTLTETTNIF